MSDTTENAKNEDDEFSILNFIQNNIIQLLLLGLVIIVIYVVDQITHFNNILISIQQQKMMKEQIKQMKKGNKKSK